MHKSLSKHIGTTGIKWPSLVVLAGLWLNLGSVHAQYYQPGDIVQDFTLTNRTTRLPTHLTDFHGTIVLLDWFAWWCPYCQLDAPIIKSEIDNYYATNHGNPAGIPVLHVGINLQPDQEQATSNYIYQAGLTIVLEDFNRLVADKFQGSNQPIYAIINCVTNSPNTLPYQLLLHQDGHISGTTPDISAFRAAIDAVQGPTNIVRVSVLSNLQLTNGLFSFTVAGPSTQNYRIDVSTDLKTWNPLTSVFGSNTPVTITDSNSAKSPARYYRAVAQ